MPKAVSKMEAVEIARRFAPLAKEIWPCSAVYLFGSYAKGCQRDESDIDIAVILPDYGGMTPKELNAARVRLWTLGGDIDDRIEPCVRTVKDASGFVKTIVDTGIRVDLG